MYRIKSTKKLSNSGFHRVGGPAVAGRDRGKHMWWARVDGEFLKFPPVRGDDYLDIEVDLEAGTKVEIGCGEVSGRDSVRETIIIN